MAPDPASSLADDAGIWQDVAELTDQAHRRVQSERDTLIGAIDALASQLEATPHSPVAEHLRSIVARHVAA